MIEQLYFWVYTQKIWKQGLEVIFVHLFTAALFTIVKRWKQSTCPSMEEWRSKLWYVRNDGISANLEKEANSDVCYDTDESWRHCGKISQSQKDQCYTTSLLWGTWSRPIHEERKQTGWLPGARARGTWGIVNGARGSVLQDEKSSGDA